MITDLVYNNRCVLSFFTVKKKQAYFGSQFWSFEPMLKQQFETEVSQGAKPFIPWSGSKTEEEERAGDPLPPSRG